MIERLVVAPGRGTVIRHGHVAAWAGEPASPGLLTFLVESARNLAASPIGGDQLADHLAGVLHRRDPEPHVPFVVIGPSEEGWVALLHGPAGVWNGEEWTAPGPPRGWMRTVLAPHSVLVAGPIGPADPTSGLGTLFDLEGGVVPGGGFRLSPSASAVRDERPDVTAAVAVAAGPAGPAGADPGGPAAPQPALEPEPEPEPSQAEVTALLEAAEAVAAEVAPPPPEPLAPPADPAPPGVLDLRRTDIHARVAAHPPLPPAGESISPAVGGPVIAGVSCARHHLNRPGTTRCARCGQPVVAEATEQTSGARPALGCLITDRGSVYRLDSGYLVGSDPAKDPTVRGRLARPLALSGPELAPAHAEIRLQDWDVVLTDRASDGGTYVYAPGARGWDRLPPYEPRVLEPGSHVAFGQSVVTFVSPWRDDDI
jgi:hypothetical protein